MFVRLSVSKIIIIYVRLSVSKIRTTKMTSLFRNLKDGHIRNLRNKVKRKHNWSCANITHINYIFIILEHILSEERR